MKHPPAKIRSIKKTAAATVPMSASNTIYRSKSNTLLICMHRTWVQWLIIAAQQIAVTYHNVFGRGGGGGAFYQTAKLSSFQTTY
jgi:hypothetical protein